MVMVIPRVMIHSFNVTATKKEKKKTTMVMVIPRVPLWQSSNNVSFPYYCPKETNHVSYVNSTILVAATSSPETVPVPSTLSFNMTTTIVISRVMIRSFNVTATKKQKTMVIPRVPLLSSSNNISLPYYCPKETNHVLDYDNSTILVATSSPETVPVPSTPSFNVTTTMIPKMTTMVIPNVTASSREIVPVPSTALVMIRSFNVATTTKTKTMVTLTFNSIAVVIVSSPFLGLTSMATPTFNSTALVILPSFQVQLDGTWWETTSTVLVVLCMIIIIVLMFRSLPQRRRWYQHREWMQEQQHQIQVRDLQQQDEEKQGRRWRRQQRATIFLWGNCRFIMVDLETEESFPFDVSFERVVHRTNLFIDSSSNRDDILRSTTRFETWIMVEQEWLRRIVMLGIIGGADHPLVKSNIIALRVYHENKHSLQCWMEEITGVDSAASGAFVPRTKPNQTEPNRTEPNRTVLYKYCKNTILIYFRIHCRQLLMVVSSHHPHHHHHHPVFLLLWP